MTGLAFFDAEKPDTLELKLMANQERQLYALEQYVTSRGGGVGQGQVQLLSQRLEYFGREESDLSFVIIPVIKKTIALDATTGDTFDRVDFNGYVAPHWPAVMTEEVVTR